MVLVHGVGGSAAGSWGPIQEPLARTHTVVAPDNPGSAQTPVPRGPLDLDDLADRVAETAVRAGLEDFVLVAQSFGCAIAARLAARHPGRVRALILIAGFARARPSLRLHLDTWEDLLDADARTRARFLTSVSWPSAYLNGLTDAELADLLAGSEASQPGVRQHIEVARRADVTADLPGIKARTLVVVTGLDQLVSPDHSDDFLAGIPGAERADLPAGHSVVAERPVELMRIIDAFIDRTKEYKNDFLDGIEARGKAKALMTVLTARNIELSPEQRDLVVSCLNHDQFDTWITRAVTATSADDVFKN